MAFARRFQAWKRNRRMSKALSELTTRQLNPSPHNLDAPLVVSLTSYPRRYDVVPYVLKDLASQTIKPDAIWLWLAQEDFDSFPKDKLPDGVEIRVTPDHRSYNKIIPTIRACPDAYIVTADDDQYYGPNWLERLIKYPREVTAHRAHKITLKDGSPANYGTWTHNMRRASTDALVFPTGVGGVLYPPGIWHEDICRSEFYRELAPTADDIWLYWMHRLQGSTPRKIGGRQRSHSWPGSQDESLFAVNSGVGGGNDKAIAAMVRRYGFPN